MQPAPESAASNRPQLRAALLDHQRYPGKYSLARKEPAVLFGSIRAVLQIAAGKSGDEGEADLQPAACFFVRWALMYPGADHYTQLGLPRTTDAATVKEHYRLLMRLVHPDFAAASRSIWPSDAATRLNLAYEVLAAPDKRARYDETLAATSAPRSAPPGRNVNVVPVKPVATEPRVLVRRLAGGFGVAGALGVAAVFAGGLGDRESLIQRPAALTGQFLPPVGKARLQPPAPSAPDIPTAPPSHSTGLQPLATTIHPAPDEHWPTLATQVTASMAVAVPPSPAVPVPAENPERAPAIARRDALAPAPAVASPPPPPVTAAPAAVLPAPPPPAPPPAIAVIPQPYAGVTLADAQPLLATLLQQVESGRGDRLLNLLDRDARNDPAARALSRQLEGLVNGVRPVTLSHVEFRPEPAEGRLYVVGHIRLHAGKAGAIAKKLSMRVEFMSRDGAVVMTGFSALGEN